jgi:hypothetical protein
MSGSFELPTRNCFRLARPAASPGASALALRWRTDSDEKEEEEKDG